MRRRALLALSFCSLLVACAGSLERPVERDLQYAAQRWPEATLGKLETGRTLYITKCAGCHDLHQPTELGPERWEPKVTEMSKEAHLSLDEQRLVVAYLSSISARVHGIPLAAAPRLAN